MKRTIQKVLTELSKDKPNLSYIRGLLESLVDEESSIVPTIGAMRVAAHPVLPLSDESMTDEQKTTAARYAAAGLGRIS